MITFNNVVILVVGVALGYFVPKLIAKLRTIGR